MDNLVGLDASAAPRLLPPCAATVIALAERSAKELPPPLLPFLRLDPGAWAMTLHLCGDLGPRRWEIHQSAQLTQRLLEEWTRQADRGLAHWSSPYARACYQAALASARLAERLAGLLHLDADEAYSLGLMAWLGPLVQSLNAHDPRWQDVKPTLLTRRLARRWNWPAWLTKALQKWESLSAATESNSLESRRGWMIQAAIEAVRTWCSWPADRPWPFPHRDALARLSLSVDVVAPLRHEVMDATPPASVGPEAAPLIHRVVAWMSSLDPRRSDLLLARCEEEIDELRQQMQESRQQQDEQLRNLKLAALAEFAAGASHEINNPLAVISAQAQHLLKSEEVIERAKALERIITQARRIHTLLRDVMMFARPPEPRWRTLKPERLIQQAMTQHLELAAAREVRVEGPRGRSKATFQGDPDLLVTALGCLLRNAIEAAPSGGWVRIQTQMADRSHLLFVVEDNGPGLPDAMRWQLFDPFFSGRSAGRGIGMGLPKVWRIAELHGGTIQLASTAGQPTRFELRLPLKPAQAQGKAKGTGALRAKMAARHTKPRRRKRS